MSDPAAEAVRQLYKDLLDEGKRLREAGDLAAALAAFTRLVERFPNSAEGHLYRARIFAGDWRTEEALASFQRVIELQPKNAAAHVGLGMNLRRARRFEEAAVMLQRAIALGQVDDAQYDRLSLCQLMLGQFEDGWKSYERRVDANPAYDRAALTPPEHLTALLAKGGLVGKTVQVHPEIGLGDTFLFSRYFRLLERAGARVLFAPQAPIRNVMATLPGAVTILAGPPKTPPDYQVRIMSLPYIFGTRLETIPNIGVYLSAKADKVAAWQTRLGGPGFKIGVCWSGKARPAARRFPIAGLAGLGAIPGVRLISLQKGDGIEQLDDLPPGMVVERLAPDGPNSFEDTAAVIMNCDLVISCDTSVAHLAGALGRRTWVALPWLACWRWMREGPASPWYSNVTVFRQTAVRDWTNVFEEMREALGKELRPVS